MEKSNWKAIETRTEYLPFLVGWNPYGGDDIQCTGSLITQSFFLSASHCLGKDIENTFFIARGDCLKNTARKGFHKGKREIVQCRLLPTGDLELVVDSPKPKVWHGVYGKEEVGKMNNVRLVKRQIRHEFLDLGISNYDIAAGYDICLVELEKPFIGSLRACLASPNFDDIRLDKKDSIMAEYGEHLRARGKVCQTNRYGMMKYHYCDHLMGDGANVCETSRHPPNDRECDDFFNNQKTPALVPKNVEEIKILDLNSRKTILCYPKINPEGSDIGWCVTRGNFYNPKNIHKKFQGWGFCSKSCTGELNHVDNHTLRIRDKVDVLPENLCSSLMNWRVSMNITSLVSVLCVAQIKEFKESVWLKSESGYVKLKSRSKASRYGVNTYVGSPETCDGFFGGPLFVKESDRYVLTGIEIVIHSMIIHFRHWKH